MRKTAIDAVGEAPWGTHFCQFYQTKEDLTNILVPFFKAGLENNEFCMWITSEPLSVAEAKNALNTEVKNLDDYIKKGQIEILDYSRWYTKAGHFDTDKVLQAALAKEKQALENGFDGLRVTGNISWLKKKDWNDFVDYEAIINRIIDNHQMLTVCSYCIDKCTASEIIDVLSNHQFALAMYQDDWDTIESPEHKKATEMLHDIDKQYMTLCHNILGMVYRGRHDWSTDIISNSEAVCGYSYHEFSSGQINWLDIVHPDDKQNVLKQAGELEQKRKSIVQQYRIIDKDGGLRWIEDHKASRFTDTGTFLGVDGVAFDITKRKDAEAELEEYKDEVHKAQKYAYISSMGAIVAHQLNQPLNMINMLLGKALEQDKESFSPPVLKIIEKSLLEVGKTTSIITKFRQSFNGEALEVEGTANISSTAEKIISALSGRAEYAKMRILVKGLDDLPEVKINKVAIEQLFFIIIQNAIEAAENKKRHKLNISGKLANGNIELQFSDNCCGIAPENLEKIFKPFFSTKPNGKGLGLGLAIIKQMLISYGGEIRVESQLGRGTTVYVTLPINNISKS